jgi:23S rRNA (cytidine1920-2'-O)/16S rRNA (cytidine1409-2'-O)-methyltransferase
LTLFAVIFAWEFFITYAMSVTMAKIRTDILMVTRGLAPDAARAQALILAGVVYMGERKIDKAGEALRTDAPLEVRGKPHPWVSRGGIKLDHALTCFNIDVAGATAIDVGASTGGFSDVLLTRGAAKIYAVDVGHGQLAWKLQTDARIIILDKTNARHLTAEIIPDFVDIIVCDASFISLKSVLPASLARAKIGAHLCALIKPQFEVAKSELHGGVVRERDIHLRVCDEMATWLNSLDGWQSIGITQSPITGPEGNIEFIIAAHYRGDTAV